MECVILVQKFLWFHSTVLQFTTLTYFHGIQSRFRCLLMVANLCLWLSITAVVTTKFLTRIRFHFRNAVWTDADQSGIGLYSVKVPAKFEQENSSSIGVWHKNRDYDNRSWNVVADQKADEVKHCGIICLYKKTSYYTLCSLFVSTSCKI